MLLFCFIDYVDDLALGFVAFSGGAFYDGCFFTTPGREAALAVYLDEATFEGVFRCYIDWDIKWSSRLFYQ